MFSQSDREVSAKIDFELRINYYFQYLENFFQSAIAIVLNYRRRKNTNQKITTLSRSVLEIKIKNYDCSRAGVYVSFDREYFYLSSKEVDRIEYSDEYIDIPVFGEYKGNFLKKIFIYYTEKRKIEPVTTEEIKKFDRVTFYPQKN
ncbi:MAG: hypothetical protein ACFBSE_12605 [Prochloraceae cyanobacterium]